MLTGVISPYFLYNCLEGKPPFSVNGGPWPRAKLWTPNFGVLALPEAEALTKKWDPFHFCPGLPKNKYDGGNSIFCLIFIPKIGEDVHPF